MVNPKIGISNGAPNASSYDAVDLLEASHPEERYSQKRAATAVADTTQYTIDSDEESIDDDGSSDDVEGEDETSSDDDDDNDDDEESTDDDDDDDLSDDNGTTTTSKTQNGVNSVAATEVMSNLLNNPPAQHYSSPTRGVSNTPKKKSIIPPASTFKNIGRRLPSYMLKGGKRAAGKDKLGNHQRLSTIDQDDGDDNDVERNSKHILMDKPVNRMREPSKFPLEQYSGQDFGSYSYSTTYASADPSSVNYEPKPLRRMPVDLSNGLEEKKRKIVFYGFLTAIVICFLIALTSIITHKKRHHVLSPPPSLENICDIANISTKQGHQECEKACEEAKCCMAPGINSCFEGQEEVCRMYSPCAALYTTNSDTDLHVMVPPAPGNLPQLCSYDSIMFVSGYIECNAACQAGMCCTIPEMDNSDLAAGLVDLTNIPKSCVNSHPELCAGYKQCSALKGVKNVHGRPNDLVKSKCTPTNMQTEIGIDECENACQPRACCFANSKKRNCYDDNQIWCDEFQYCKILTDQDYEPIEDENEDSSSQPVTERCRKDFRELSTEEASMCKMICNPVSCCFYEDVGCTRDIDCDFYSFCSTLLTSESGSIDVSFGPGDENIDEILPPSGGQHSPGPSQEEVENACGIINSRNLSSFHPFHEKKCSTLCSNYMCCFEDDYNPASCHEQNTCTKYSACEELLLVNGNSDTPDVCSIDNLLKSGGYTQCEEHCSDHMCCFDPFGCENYDSHHCEKHQQCVILSMGVVEGTDIHGKAQFDHKVACSKEVVYGDDIEEDLCDIICAKHKCCWDDSLDPAQSASCSTEEDCSDYEPCKILNEDEYYYYYYEDKDNEDSKSVETLKGVCKKDLVLSQDNFFSNSCIDACEDAKCCYDGTCEYKASYCAQRTACSSVSRPSLACSEDFLSKGVGEGACQNACDIFSCCWEEHGCYATHEIECLAALKHCKRNR